MGINQGATAVLQVRQSHRLAALMRLPVILVAGEALPQYRGVVVRLVAGEPAEVRLPAAAGERAVGITSRHYEAGDRVTELWGLGPVLIESSPAWAALSGLSGSPLHGHIGIGGRLEPTAATGERVEVFALESPSPSGGTPERVLWMGSAALAFSLPE